jgi:alkylation response protein AidB-like acyl-CoA dehydrogenase
MTECLVTQNAITAVELAVEASGNPGLSRNNALERHHRDVLCSRHSHAAKRRVAQRGRTRGILSASD